MVREHKNLRVLVDLKIMSEFRETLPAFQMTLFTPHYWFYFCSRGIYKINKNMK